MLAASPSAPSPLPMGGDLLVLEIPRREYFNDQTNTFVTIEPFMIKMEHSLESISKWESRWKKPFLSETPHTESEAIDYIVCMNLSPEVPESAIRELPISILIRVADYIKEPVTATTIQHYKESTGSETVTAEIIYYWMTAMSIPFECDKWPFDKLMKLIDVCSIKNSENQKMTKADSIARQRKLMAQRRKKK